MKLLKKGSATVLAASMLLTCAAASACAHTHDYTEWKYSTTQHWKICAADGEIGEDTRGAHDFSGSSTCKCGYLMGDTIDYGDHTHSYTRWGYNSTQHWKECPDDFEADTSSYAEHSYVDGVCLCGRTDGTSSEGPVTPAPTPGATHVVTFVTNTTQTYDPQTVSSGSTVLQPTGLTNGNKYIAGWYTTENFAEGTQFNFAMAITKDYTLYAKWADLDKAVKALKSYNESLAVEFEDANPSAATVQYKPVSGGNYVTVDKELVRSYNGAARVDIVGLKAGSYSVKITTSGGSSFDIPEVNVSAYDRSGYAHFKYTEGVGAYNDDGTLKDNAIVIYVTDENKDYVMRDVAAENSAINMFKVPGSDWGNKDAEGIGWWLNNNQYTSSNAGSSKNKVPSNTYDAANGKNLGFSLVNASHPIVIRFIGSVSTPEGCTAYNCEKEGGGVGDNGHMARLKNLKNVTLEGIGEDATINGWGFHFVAGTDGVNGQGSGFEVRNLTFDKYPEDAIGMEGQQSGSTITAAVSRCWIHHNTFLPGYCANPAESDKGEGDGSCDFKRGEYFTCSYNYFTDCHKTNLIGSSDSSLQYNMTYHHNWWHNCGSRIPLARQANVHFYNNYVSADTTKKVTMSYVHDVRANANIFSEGNYYLGSKNLCKSGNAKFYNNEIVGCFTVGTMTIVNDREQKVSNNCKYGSIDYSSFDTDPNLFYYNTEKKKSDCLLDEPEVARIKAIRGAGVNGWGENNPKKSNGATAAVKEQMQDSTPTETVAVPEEGELTVDFKAPPKGVTLNGSVSSGKFKSTKGGQLAIINLATPATITATSADSGDIIPQLVAANGKLYATIEGTVSVEVPAGVYIILPGNYSYEPKQSTLSSLSFKTAKNSIAFKFAALNEAIDALPATVTASSGALVKEAQNALDALKADELAKYKTDEAARYTKLENALTTYNNIVVSDCIAKINAIGTVNEDSGTKIAAARNAYNNLTVAQKQLVTNYGTLTAAESAYVNYEVTGVNKAITKLADPSTATTEAQIRSLLAEYETVDSMYSSLKPAQKTQVTGYSKVTNGIAALESKLKPFTVRELIAALPAKANVTMDDAEAVKEARVAYDALTAEQKTAVGDISKLTDAEAAINDIASQAVVAIFTSSDASLATSAGFTVSGKYNSKGSFEYNGTSYTGPLKLESSTSVTFSTAVAQKLTIKIGSNGGQLKVDGTVYKDDDNDGFIIINSLGAGSHSITKASGDPNLCYVTLTAA